MKLIERRSMHLNQLISAQQVRVALGLLTICAPLCAVHAADSPSSPPVVQKESGKKSAQMLQTVVVTGLRASLMEAMKL